MNLRRFTNSASRRTRHSCVPIQLSFRLGKMNQTAPLICLSKEAFILMKTLPKPWHLRSGMHELISTGPLKIVTNKEMIQYVMYGHFFASLTERRPNFERTMEHCRHCSNDTTLLNDTALFNDLDCPVISFEDEVVLEKVNFWVAGVIQTLVAFPGFVGKL